MSALAAYVLAAILSWSPVAVHASYEHASATEARLTSIAVDIADVAATEPPLFAGDDGRARTAILLAAVASYESGRFDGRVQSCERRGDHGHALGLWQVHASWAESCTTVREAARVALGRMRESFAACLPTGAPALAAYASGDCRHGWLAAGRRWERAAEWMKTHPVGAP